MPPQSVYDQLPIPLMAVIMAFGLLMALVAAAPSAWIDRAYHYLRRRFGQGH